MTDRLPMQCYCERTEHYKQNCDGGDIPVTACPNEIPYMNHHEWGCSSDYMCDDCVENCEAL